MTTPRKLRTLHHGMLLDSKSVMDEAMPELGAIRELIPAKLHGDFQRLLDRFEDYLCECDVRDDYLDAWTSAKPTPK